MIMNFPCLDCFRSCVGLDDPVTPPLIIPVARRSSFLEAVKARVVPQTQTTRAPKTPKVTGLTICQICEKLNRRNCVTKPCCLVKARADTWRQMESDLLADTTDSVYSYRSMRQSTNQTFFDYQDRDSYGGIDNASRLYISKPAKQKSAHYMYLFLFWAPIYCDGCGSEFIPIYDYNNRKGTISGANNIACICPFCGWWSVDWKKIFKAKVWDYVFKEPEDMRRIIKWSMPRQ